jgi:hypothetical protein
MDGLSPVDIHMWVDIWPDTDGRVYQSCEYPYVGWAMTRSRWMDYYQWISICRLKYDQIQMDGFTIPVDIQMWVEIWQDPVKLYPYVGWDITRSVLMTYYLWISIHRLRYQQIRMDGLLPVDILMWAEIRQDPDRWIITCGYLYVDWDMTRSGYMDYYLWISMCRLKYDQIWMDLLYL